MTAIVRVDRLEKSYGDRVALRGISLEVESGEWIALMGRSGSGKSSLLQIVGGLDRGYRGTVVVGGRDLAELSDGDLAQLRNREVGFVFQSFHLLDHLTVLENAELPAFFAGGRSRATCARAEDALERVGMRDRSNDRPAALSGGQKQRVAIARALYAQPSLLLADEPTGNLDRETGGQIIELFRQLNADGLTLWIVTHEERVSRAAGRVVHLDGGVIRPAAGDAPIAAQSQTLP